MQSSGMAAGLKRQHTGLFGPLGAEVASANDRAEEKLRHDQGHLALAKQCQDLEGGSVSEDTPLLSKEASSSSGEGRWSWLQIFFSAGALTIGIVWILLGVAVLVWVLDWQHVTAFYVITQIVTTIGYGDHVPLTQSGKLFVTFYALVTILLIGTLLTEMMSSVVRVHLAQVMERLTDHSSSGPTVWDRLLAGFLCFAAFVALGTLFFGLYESCSCSYGIDRVKGCTPGPTCAATGGYVKTWVDCFYMSVISLTTLGFGDNRPVSKVGRLFLIPWCLIGTISMANFAATFGEALWSLKEEKMSLGRISREIFDGIEKEDPEALSRHEFRNFALLKFNLVTQGDLHMIDELFGKLDTDRDGRLTWPEVEKQF